MNTFIFIPVCVNRGKKFRGNAYSIGEEPRCTGGNIYTSWSIKLWDPINMRYVYANPDFVENRDPIPTPEQIETDKQAYIKGIVDSTLTWCRSNKPNGTDDEIKNFARNIICKQHPEIVEYINDILPDTRDVVAAVQNTLQWVSTLKTRPCVVYGHRCPGGKPLSNKRKLEIAHNVLAKKGYSKLPGFNETWNLTITIMGLTK